MEVCAYLSLDGSEAGRVIRAEAEDSGVEESRNQSLLYLLRVGWCAGKVPELEGQRSADTGCLDCGDIHAFGGSVLMNGFVSLAEGEQRMAGVILTATKSDDLNLL